MIKDDGEQLPPEIGKSNTTLLVAKHKRGYDKVLDKEFKKYYTGDYLLIDAKEINDPKFQDIKKYRYLFDGYQSTSTFTDYSKSNGFSNYTATGQGYSVFDRSENKKYASKIESGLWKKMMRVYVQKLNQVYEKNAHP
jgi:hypothetical protein